jgi:hypothetical protein
VARFFLIDPSILDYQGHHFEYAQRVLRAAREEGYEPVMAVNRRCRVGDDSIRTLAVYRFGFWFLASPRASSGAGHRRRPSWGDRCGAMALRWLYSPVGLWIATWLRVAKGIATAAGSMVGAASQVWHRALRGFARLGVVAWGWRQLKLRQFVRDTRTLFASESPGEGDLAFLPVASLVELAALERLFRRAPELLRGSWHIVFRHNLNGPSTSNAYDESTRPFRNGLRRFVERMPAGRFHFYTDSEQLSAQYNALGVVEFRTLPVPVVNGPRAHALRSNTNAPIRIAYLGDARREKGYQHLPRLAADVLAGPTLAQFTIQSNLSHGGSAAEVALALSQLEAIGDERVRLLRAPLTPAEYRDQLLNADLLLLPYDRASYFARSSGVLAEALAAGIPVVVPAGTWMAIQLGAAHYAYHCEMRETFATRNVVADSERVLTQGRRAEFSVDVSPGATHAVVAFDERCDVAAQFVRVRLTEFRGDGRVLRRQSRVIGGADGAASCLVPVRRGARRLEMAIGNAYSDARIVLRGLRVDLLNVKGRSPHSAVGTIMNSPTGLTRATREILRHFEHYRATAGRLAPEWGARHHPRQLVLALREESVGATSTSPVGRLPAPHFGRSVVSRTNVISS